MYTVFVNDKPLRLVNTYAADEWNGKTESRFITENDMDVADAIRELENTDAHPGFVFLAANPDVAWQLLVSSCTLIEASGGLVTNDKNEYLVIFRKGKYDLPKGKLDYDETPEQAGLREVREECGVGSLSIVRPLEKTFHTYLQKKTRMLKKTHWFLMKTTDQPLTPQADEDIEKAEWMTAQRVKDVALQNTYASIGELLRKNLSL